MPNDRLDRTFPANCLAATAEASPPEEELMEKLEELADRLDERHCFVKGQIAQGKPCLKNRKFPDNGEPAIVTAVTPAPVFDPSESSAASPYFQEPLTLVIGVFHDEDLMAACLSEHSPITTYALEQAQKRRVLSGLP